MILHDQSSVTEAAVRSLRDCPDVRLRGVMAAVFRHAHELVRELRPTEREMEAVSLFLNGIGQASNSRHNEAVLMLDTWGVSTLAALLNDGCEREIATSTALLGPFWRDASPETELGQSILRSESLGAPLAVRLVFSDADGRPLEGVEVDIWQASPAGLYDNHDPEQADMNLRGRFRTDPSGEVRFTSIMPAGYPIPTHGPAGQLVLQTGRRPVRPAHIHVLAMKASFQTLVSEVYVDDDPDLACDVSFGVTRPLVGAFERVGEDDQSRFELRHAFAMVEGRATRPRAPIA